MFSSQIDFVDHMVVYTPIELLSVCEKLDIDFPDVEFSILTKIEKIEGNEIYLSSEHYVPVQKVSHSSVIYGSDEKADEYDVVIHKHPEGCLEFSGTDEEFINQNHKLSILYTKDKGFINGDVKSGMYNIKLETGTMFPVPIYIMIDYSNISVETKSITEVPNVELLPTPPSLQETRETKKFKEVEGLKLYPHSGVEIKDIHERATNAGEFGYYDKQEKFHYFTEADKIQAGEGFVHVPNERAQLCETASKNLKASDLTLDEWHVKCEWTEMMLDETTKSYSMLEEEFEHAIKTIDELEAEIERLEADVISAEIIDEMGSI